MPPIDEKTGMKPPRGQEAIAQRRERVASLLARNFSKRQIAEALGVPPTTVQRDIEAVRPALRKALDEKAPDIYTAAAAEMDEVRRELWRNYARTPEHEVGLRASILMKISTLPERLTRLGQSLGLVESKVPKVSVDVKLQEELWAILKPRPK